MTSRATSSRPATEPKIVDGEAMPLTLEHTALSHELGIVPGTAVTAQQGAELTVHLPALPGRHVEVTGRRPAWVETTTVTGAYAVSCVGCCWALMAITFAVGAAAPPVMVVLAAIMATEREH